MGVRTALAWGVCRVAGFVGLVLCVLSGLPSQASTRSSANYTMIAEVVDAGGSLSSWQSGGSSHSLRASVAPIAGADSHYNTTVYLLQHGYIPKATANRPPLATTDLGTTTANTAALIAVLDNDSDPDGEELVVLSATTPTHGSVAINGGASVTYTPGPGFVGSDSFDYTAGDGLGDIGVATVTVTVNEAYSNWTQSQFTSEEQAEPTISGLTADPDRDGRSNLLEYALGLNPKSGGDGGSGINTAVVDDSGTSFLRLGFKRRKNDPSLHYVPEVSGDGQTWLSDPDVDVQLISVEPLDAEYDWVIYQDRTATVPDQPRFFRLRITQE